MAPPGHAADGREHSDQILRPNWRHHGTSGGGGTCLVLMITLAAWDHMAHG